MLRRVFGGGILIVAGIAAFIEAHAHMPVAEHGRSETAVERVLRSESGFRPTVPASGLSQTAYDVLRIGAWALLVFGVLLATVGLIGYVRRPA